MSTARKQREQAAICSALGNIDCREKFLAGAAFSGQGASHEKVVADFCGRDDFVDRCDGAKHGGDDTGTGRAAVQIEPEYRTRIRTYVTEHKIRPVQTKEKIVVGSPLPRDVELEAVPTEWGPSLTRYRYVYSGERVMLVDPNTRTVVQEVE